MFKNTKGNHSDKCLSKFRVLKNSREVKDIQRTSVSHLHIKNKCKGVRKILGWGSLSIGETHTVRVVDIVVDINPIQIALSI